uniref:Uncharacterized protein n=1 Tax=Sphaerodactylus townsendi TaxID=933632 RepID=A0ACB8FNA8_9SAUR
MCGRVLSGQFSLDPSLSKKYPQIKEKSKRVLEENYISSGLSLLHRTSCLANMFLETIKEVLLFLGKGFHRIKKKANNRTSHSTPYIFMKESSIKTQLSL